MRRIERICWGVYPPKPNPELLSHCHNTPVYVYGDEGTYRFVCETCRKPCTVHTVEVEADPAADKT
jgi:hypothetical protein